MESRYCMRCGRELEPGLVFCQECRDEMERYPVKPGVVVQLPHRKPQAPKPQTRRRAPAVPAEEQVKRLKKRILHLWAALLLALTLASVLGWFHISDMLEEKNDQFLPGQNYTSEKPEGTPLPARSIGD